MEARPPVAKSARCLLLLAVLASSCARQADIVTEPYMLDTHLASRSISFENPTGAPGQGGKAASKLGVGRKGSPAITLKAGQDVQLCDIEGPGTIRHIWMTTAKDPVNRLVKSLFIAVIAIPCRFAIHVPWTLADGCLLRSLDPPLQSKA